uniref:hypothetical protein n=1 Tax=Arthrobacter sp. TaxID=1667 RepID=UPI0028A15838
WISGAKINFQDADSAYVLSPEGDYQVLIQFTQDPLEFRGPDGKVYETHPGSSKPVAQIMEAKFLAGQWFVEQLSSM